MDADESKRPPECASEFAASTARARADFEAPPSARTRAASGCSSPPTCAQLVAVVLVARSVAAFHLLAVQQRRDARAPFLCPERGIRGLRIALGRRIVEQAL